MTRTARAVIRGSIGTRSIGSGLRPALLALTLVAFALRVWRIDFQPLWWDEGLSVYRTGLAWAGIVAESTDNVHPPGYFLLLGLWSHVAGPSAVATRLLSALFDTLSIPLLAAVGTRLGGRRIGLVAAALMAVNPFHVYHAQQARMYALVPCLVLMATLLLLRIEAAYAPRVGDRRAGALGRALAGGPADARVTTTAHAPTPPGAGLAIAAYVVTLAAALHVHYFTIFVPAFHSAHVVLRRRLPLRRWAGILAATAVLCLPWAIHIGRQVFASAASKVRAEGTASLDPVAYGLRYLVTTSGGYNVSTDPMNRGALGEGGLFYLALILTLLGAAAWRRRRPADRRPALPVLWVAIPVVGGFLVNLRAPFDSFPRLLAYTGPGLWLLWAAALVEAWDRRRRIDLLVGSAAVLVASISLARHYTVPREPEEDYRPLAAQLRSLAGRDDAERGRDLVIADFPWQAGYLRAYAPVLAPRVWLPPGSAWAAELGAMERDLARLVAAGGDVRGSGEVGVGGGESDGGGGGDGGDGGGIAPARVWYIAYQGMGGTRGRNIEAWLTANTFLARDAWFGDTRLLLFGGGRRGEGAGDGWRAVGAPVGDAIRLMGARLANADVAAGNVLPVELRWEASARPVGRFKVFAHLLDRAGAAVAQHDAEPAFGARPTVDWAPGDVVDHAFGIQVPWAMPAGEYPLAVGMYDPATGARLPTGAEGDRIEVGTVRIIDSSPPAR